MTTPVVADLIVGPARVFYAPVGEALPDESSIGYGDAWGGNWTEVGRIPNIFICATGFPSTMP